MKKTAVMVILVAMSAAGFASSLAVPWFMDGAPADGAFPPSGGTASWIALKNNTDVEMTCWVYYLNADGTDSTPVDNTFVIPAGAAMGFRPFRLDAATEGPGSAVPDKAAAPGTGSCRIEWEGGPSDIQGRLLQVNSAGNTGMYLLPPGT